MMNQTPLPQMQAKEEYTKYRKAFVDDLRQKVSTPNHFSPQLEALRADVPRSVRGKKRQPLRPLAQRIRAIVFRGGTD